MIAHERERILEEIEAHLLVGLLLATAITLRASVVS
jgi:hypothetical protein